MASWLRNIYANNRQNLLIFFKGTIDNVRVLFWGTVYYEYSLTHERILTLVLCYDDYDDNIQSNHV